ncbi:MAG: transcriptional regulator GcvA [Aestuariivirgaceae bacterium]
MARRDLPPLRALTAFEAAARLGSFRRAAEELGITRSAVSHQIKALEGAMGIDLFRRDTRRAELSTIGQVYFPAIREAFDQIETHTQFVKPSKDDSELTLQVYVTVALKWLIPRLYDFERRYPDMRVRLSTSYFDWDFNEQSADAAFILVREETAGQYRHPLFGSVLRPVCSPQLLTGDNAIRTPEDLKNHRLLHVYTAEEDWQIWLDAAGVADIGLSENLVFDSYILSQEAAVEGRGVAMTIGPFADDDIAAGRLAYPFELTVPHRHSWQFVCSNTQRLKPKIRRFENWLAEQVAADPTLAAVERGAITEARQA